MKPNIFEIATKELNQDSFITWLLKYADYECKISNEALNTCGKLFIKSLITKQIPDFQEEIIRVSAGRQWQNIDVWAKINDKYLIIIEDKTNSSQHSNQLPRYKKLAEDWAVENSFNPPICIYLKTGNESQSSLNKIKKIGFFIYNRQDFLKLLENSKEVKNDIFLDFYERLKRLEKSNNIFEDKLIGKWNGSDWQGFFQYLEKQIGLVNWNYVNNPSGGFWNAVLNWDNWDIYPAYLQIEEGKLCFKISTHPEDVTLPENIDRRLVRDKFHKLLIKKSEVLEKNYIRKPNRFGNGKYMTAAIVDKKNWLGEEDKTINKEEVVKKLKYYKSFLEDAIK